MAQSLSIVVTGRNDNYGGQFTKNLQQFLSNTSRLLPEAEIILVEWNPPKDKAPLSVLWPKGVRGRIITVPNSVHSKIGNPRNLPLLEYWAKNVGIRRSKKDFILATNPDTLISIDLSEEIRGHLRSDTYYRTNRTDIDPVPEGHKGLLNWTHQHTIITHKKWGSYVGLDLDAHFTAFFRRVRRHWMYRSLVMPHENAAGDFLLASRQAWSSMGGYPELPLASHIDSIMTCLLHREYKLHTFKGNLYHQDHERRLFLRDSSADRAKAKIMQGHPPKTNPGWGLDWADLKEERMN